MRLWANSGILPAYSATATHGHCRALVRTPGIHWSSRLSTLHLSKLGKKDTVVLSKLLAPVKVKELPSIVKKSLYPQSSSFSRSRFSLLSFSIPIALLYFCSFLQTKQHHVEVYFFLTFTDQTRPSFSITTGTRPTDSLAVVFPISLPTHTSEGYGSNPRHTRSARPPCNFFVRLAGNKGQAITNLRISTTTRLHKLPPELAIMAQRGPSGYGIPNAPNPFGGPSSQPDSQGSALDAIREQTSKIEDMLDSISEPVKPYVFFGRATDA